MKKTERQEQRILEQLRRKNTLTLAQAMELLNVSESTVRRLFIRLENSGAAMRRYGGIQLLHDSVAVDYQYEQVEEQSVSQKQLIGRYAARLVEADAVLYLDSGTTMACFCKELASRIATEQLGKLTVFTNSLVNLEILSPFVTVNLIGGAYRSNRRDFCGYLAEEMVNSLHFSKCFLGADGFHLRHGFTATDFYTARLNELVLANAEQRYILMDSSKFMTASVVSYSREQKIDAVITDRSPEEPLAQALQDNGTEILVCL